jgi:hypothetical protein
MISEVSAHGYLAPLFMGNAETEASCGGPKLFISWQLGRKEEEGEREKSGSHYSFQGHITVTYFLQLGPTSKSLYHLLVVPTIGDQAFNS